MNESAPAGGDTLDAVDWDRYDFIDLGSSKGGSLEFCQKRFGAGLGLGIDNDPDKVATARAHGAEVVLGDATRLPATRSVRFVSMIDFLEHLPDLQTVEGVLASAAEAATDFLFIRHPSFEGEGYLETLGFRQYWWDWRGHPVHPKVSDYCEIFDRLGLRQYAIRYREPVRDSLHPSVLATGEPPEQGPFDSGRHGAKPLVPFAMPIWRSQDIFVALRAFEPAGTQWRRITDVR